MMVTLMVSQTHRLTGPAPVPNESRFRNVPFFAEKSEVNHVAPLVLRRQFHILHGFE